MITAFSQWGRPPGLPGPARRPVPLILLVVLAPFFVRSIRVAVADHWFRQNNLASLERAAAVDPTNARTLTWLAEHREYSGLNPVPQLTAAAARNPYHSAAWLRLGLAAEREGDSARAEQLLLHAATVDRLFEPRWALANFYFRQNRAEAFWRWIRAALEVAYGDLRNLYRLCWRMTPSPAPLLPMLPAKPWTYAQYLQFVTEEGHAAAAPDVAGALARIATRQELPLLTGYVTRTLDAGVWNTLCERRLLPYETVSAARPVTNPDFRHPFLNAGFDWRAPDASGVTLTQTASGFRVTLTGNQPERCDLLTQWLPPGAAGRVVSTPLPAGFAWRLADRQITLTYARPVGAVRYAGSFTLREVRVEP